jgi:site-specific DNA-methyltransferase (adenine-specific)
MEIKLRELSDVRPCPGNPRHNDAIVTAVAASIKELGFRQPVVIDAEGVIVCGHTRAQRNTCVHRQRRDIPRGK